MTASWQGRFVTARDDTRHRTDRWVFVARGAGRAILITEADPEKLANALEEEAETMQRRTERVGDELAQIRQDWESKRSDPNVPGAPGPPEGSGDASASEASESPGPEAPPPEAHPAEAEAPPESAVGPPADD
jgi:hypothetical protein